MDTRVKERLVGAVVLVAIIVALVPEMLSGPGHGTLVPAPDGQLRTYTIDLSPTAGTNTPPREVVPADAPTVMPEPQPQAKEATAAPKQQPDAPSESAPSRSQAPAQPSPRPDDAREVGATDSGWAVQLGSFASSDNAERLAKELRGRGYRAFVSRFDSGRSVRHRVRVGPEQDRAKAEALAQRLRREGQQASLVAHP